MTPDFFPLRVGRVLEYETRDSDGRGSVLVEVLSVDARLGRVEARCRRTTGGRSAEFMAVVDADAARTDGDLEFPLPGVVGQSWTRHPRRYEIESLEGVVDTPSGRYENCIVVRYLIAGGDAGFGRRYYAPDVGFVHESCADEADPFQISLARVQEPTP